MKKIVIILRKLQAIMKTFAPPFFNHFSKSQSKNKRVVMRAMRKKPQKQSCVDSFQNRCS